MSWAGRDLEETVEWFRSNVIQNEQPNNFCFTLSYPLSILLKFFNHNVIITGGTCQDLSHFWIRDESNPEFIIDATASQFEGLDKINYKLDPKFYKESQINWLLQYDDWAFPLKNDGLIRPYPVVAEERRVIPNYDRIRLANYRAALTLMEALKRNNIPFISWRDHLYFETIRISIHRLIKRKPQSELINHIDVVNLAREFGYNISLEV